MAFIHAFLFGCVALYLLYIFLGKRSNSLPLPPGPKALPLIGNLHQHPISAPWIKYQEWHKKYGPVISFKVGLRTVILLGNQQIFHDVLDKKGTNLSSRPRLIFMEKLTRGMSHVFAPYGPKWRELHRLTTSILTTRANFAYRSLLDVDSARLMADLLVHPWNPETFRNSIKSTVVALTYGARIDPEEESRAISEIFIELINGMAPQNILVDLFPFLEHVPGYLACQKTPDVYTRVLDIWTKRVRRTLDRDDNTWCWVRMLHQHWPSHLTSEHFTCLITEIELAIYHTTPSFLNILASVIAEQPDAVQKAQAELDAVVGANRLPTFDDHLPYVEAVMYETYRWRHLSPLGLPHTPLEDDEYMGYRIPAGAFVFINQWTMNMDENVYEQAETFRPERWLDPDLDLPKPNLFGAGRRACPGEKLAINTVFILFVRLLWGFRPIEVEDRRPNHGFKGTGGAKSQHFMPPVVDNVSFEVRSSEHRATIERVSKEMNQSDEEILTEIGASVSNPAP